MNYLINQRSYTMSKTKTSYSSMKALVEAGIIEQNQLDEAVRLGKVSMPRTGKLDFAPTEVQNAWNTFVEVVHSNGNLVEWNNSLSELGDSISEVSLNCKK
jgi:hypothetical protein